jgi:hypothetical protein
MSSPSIILSSISKIFYGQYFYMGSQFYIVCESDVWEARFNVRLVGSRMDAAEFLLLEFC